ncbi:hypothetical protein [Actinoplanes sp. TFC3]|uniref:hypothetical protein n=1 Tax=Actinoplanes sp. TFC3 TaxID=1710355 RepID=UPI000B056ACA|nr:hypothetical protein [Actinoplanes sp. TFC3]
MASWILVPCLVSLRNEFNKLAPGRDKASDGSIGDTSHAASSSDHNPDETGNTPYEDADNKNEVHAIDVDNNLRKSGWTMTRCVQVIVTRHRQGRDDRLQNVIYNRTIWSRSWGWTARQYTGASPHTEHAHFSARYTTAQESDTSPWGLLDAEEDDMPSAAEVAAEVIKQLKTQSGKDAIYDGWNQDRIQEYDTNTATGGQTIRKPTSSDNGYMTAASALTYAVKNTDWARISITSLHRKVEAIAAAVEALGRNLAASNPEVQTALTRLAEVRTEQDGLDQQILAGLGSSASVEQTAETLRDAYGPERAAQIGDLLSTKAA